MFRYFRPFFPCIVMALVSALPGSSATLYNNGSPNQQDGEDISLFIGADDFVLNSDAIVNGATFWASADVDPFFSQFSGTVGWGIFADNSGLPGPLIASGSDSSPTLSDTGVQILGTEEYQISFAIPSIPLDTGTYWLGLHENTFGTPDDGTTVYWDTTGSQSGSVAMITSDLSGMSGWFVGLGGSGSDLAFELSGSSEEPTSTPEPNTAFLLVMALGGCRCIRGKRVYRRFARA